MRQVERASLLTLLDRIERTQGDTITLNRKPLLEVLRTLAANVPGELLRVPQGSYLLADRDGVVLSLEVSSAARGSATHFKRKVLGPSLHTAMDELRAKIEAFVTDAKSREYPSPSLAGSAKEHVLNHSHAVQYVVERRDHAQP